MTNDICQGFKFAGVAAGLKKNGKPDVGLILAESECTAAGLFTNNAVKAAPVLVSAEYLQKGACQAVIVNAGNANCCTGEAGMQNARHTTAFVGQALGLAADLVAVSSTGVIGLPLPVEKIEAVVPQLISQAAEGAVWEFAAAIMTTDTVPKVITRRGSFNGREFTVMGVAKGAGMIRPDMATMLSYIMTDAAIDAAKLKKLLKVAADRSYNTITIDGDTSTNDTLIALANGLSGVEITDEAGLQAFGGVLNEVCLALARWLVKDGEGVTKVVNVLVKNAANDADAFKIADTICQSNLVKTAFFGEDANWGRILAAAGRAHAAIEPYKTDIYIGAVKMVENGVGQGREVEAEATRVLKTPEFTVTVDLKLGPGRCELITCDFSIDYVKINADYRS